MTYTELIAFITEWIATNGNNEITADVLRPVLIAIAERSEDVTGDLADLSTSDQSNLVAAINEIAALVGNRAGYVQLYIGMPSPNTTPPASFTFADFYMQVDGSNLPVQLWQYDGFTWVTTGKTHISDGEGSTVVGTGSALDPYRINVEAGAGAAIPYLTLKLKAKGITGATPNVATTLEANDVVEGFATETEYWTSAIYNGGDVAVRSNYTPIVSSSDW
jgi:hypothetical protein